MSISEEAQNTQARAYAREFLHYTYGARLEVLEQMEKRAEQTDNRVSHLNERPPLVEPPKPHWAKILSEARKRMRQGRSVWS